MNEDTNDACSITVRVDEILRKHFDAGKSKVFSYKIIPDGMEVDFETRPRTVFSPEFGEGSQLLARTMQVPKDAAVLDMGTGTGFLGIVAAIKGAARVLAVDINQDAMECAKATLARLANDGNDLRAIVEVKESDLFDDVDQGEQFDLIIFNPPFMKTKVPDGILAKFGPLWSGLADGITHGGVSDTGTASGLDCLIRSMYDEDYRSLQRFFAKVGAHLKPGGKILLAFSSVGCLHDLSQIAFENGYVMQLVDSMITDKNGTEHDKQSSIGLWTAAEKEPRYTFLAFELMPKTDPQVKNLHSRGTLRFTKFYVDLIYGVRLTEKEDETAIEDAKLKMEERLPLGWAPAYPLFAKGPNAAVRRFEMDPKSPVRLTLTVPEMWCRNGYADAVSISVSLKRFVTLRKDGTCAVTLRFKAGDANHAYTMSELLALIMLPPRTLREKGRALGSDERSQLALPAFDISDECIGKYWPAGGENKTLWQGFSSSFRLLVRTICDFCCEYRSHEERIGREVNNKTWVWKEFSQATEVDSPQGLYAGKCEYGDPQIPYVYVIAAVPLDMYRDAFLEEGDDFHRKREKRKKYTKDIAAILGRWLAPHNIPFASADYWQGQGRMQDDAFVSRYMNSLLFTTFSGMAALSLKPDLGDESVSYREALQLGICKESLELPYYPTVDSIRRCIEMSRLQWHSVMTLNQQLDDLLRIVPLTRRHKDMLGAVEELQDIRTKAAQYLDDPLSSMWDATVGSELAAFLHTSVIDRIENEVGVKINLVSRIVQDHWDYIDVRNMEENGLMEGGRQ